MQGRGRSGGGRGGRRGGGGRGGRRGGRKDRYRFYDEDEAMNRGRNRRDGYRSRGGREERSSIGDGLGNFASRDERRGRAPRRDEDEETTSGVWGYDDDDIENESRVLEGGTGEAHGEEDEREYFFSIKPLVDIGASDTAVTSLEQLGVTRPSKIQALSYSAVLSGSHCVVADQTGSGKTLAYLTPLVQRLRLEELAKVHGRAAPGRPRVMILAPTAELAQQVHRVAQQLSASMPFRPCCFTGGLGRTLKTQAKLLQEGIDVLIATPGRVSTLLEAEALSLEDCRAIVLDEVDVLFMDETFKLAPIGTCAPEDTQFIFVTATLPQSVSDMIKAEFPGVKFLLGPGLHRVAPGVEEVLIDCSGPPDEPKNEATGLLRKRDAMLAQLKRRNSLRTLIFCNTIQTCRQVENSLRRADRQGMTFQTLAYHSAIDPKQARENLHLFMRSNALSPLVMVCTDRSSRGMDFDRAEVDHVLLYDFPRDPIEYMRRVGRTARAGRKGAVTVLAWGRQVPLVREIMAGNKRGKRLLNLEDK